MWGSRVVLRRHVPENLAWFRRWYADPEIARLARYQEAPMRPDEIERFFAARVVGPEALSMAIHERAGERLVGTCAFSQLDGDNGSALYHITIGEKDAWGLGYGTEATQLMLDHAFGTLGLHRVALFVFEFNERAIRAYRRCGFVVEGRSRESIYRDGRWWDELAMSVLEADWRRAREESAESAVEHGLLVADADAGQSVDRRPVARATRNRHAPRHRRPCRAAPPRTGPTHDQEVHVSSQGLGAETARSEVRELIAAKGHTVDNARAVVARLDAAFADGSLERTDPLDVFLSDLQQALEQDEGEKLGGKSAEAARFILRAIDRELDNA